MDEKWFKNRQREVGVTADDIAKKMGRARSGVSQIYSGDRRMSTEWAKAFAEVLQVPLQEVLKRAGVVDEAGAQTLAPGFAESDVVPFVGRGGTAEKVATTAETLGGGRPGIDVWQIKTSALTYAGYRDGDSILVDTHQSELCKAGDVVIAQIYNWQTGYAETILRHYQPPALVSASTDGKAPKIDLVDGNNVVIKGKVIASWRTCGA